MAVRYPETKQIVVLAASKDNAEMLIRMAVSGASTTLQIGYNDALDEVESNALFLAGGHSVALISKAHFMNATADLASTPRDPPLFRVRQLYHPLGYRFPKISGPIGEPVWHLFADSGLDNTITVLWTGSNALVLAHFFKKFGRRFKYYKNRMALCHQGEGTQITAVMPGNKRCPFEWQKYTFSFLTDPLEYRKPQAGIGSVPGGDKFFCGNVPRYSQKELKKQRKTQLQIARDT